MAKKLTFDRLLFVTVVLLVLLGLVMVYSASGALALRRGTGWNPFAVKQAAWALVGMLVMAVAMHTDYRLLRKPAVVYSLIGAAVAALVLVLFMPQLNATRRWLFVGPISMQPSEFAKVAVIAFLAYHLERKDGAVNSREVLLPAGLVIGLVAGLVLAEPDMGTATLIVGAAVLLLFLAGLSWRYLALGAAFAIPAVAVAILSAPYRRARFAAFLDPDKEPLGSGFQAMQSLIAVGSGGVFGLGPGASVQKLYFLPYPHSDFIFAILAEELGLIGALALLILLLTLLWRGVLAGWRAPDPLGRYLAWGLTGVLVLQALLNVSVAIALFPTKGIPLPFLSYGGSSLVMSLLACGLILNVSQHG